MHNNSKFLLASIAISLIFIQCSGGSKSENSATNPSSAPAKGVKYCYYEEHNGNSTSVSLLFQADSVSGEFIGILKQHDRVSGRLSGKVTPGNELDIVVEYEMDGKTTRLAQLMKWEDEQLYIKEGEMTFTSERNEYTYKEPEKAAYSLKLSRTTCK